jgi:UDP-N-acetylmuramate dehydrogenase
MKRQYGGICERFRGEILEDEPLSRHTSLKVGGAADMFATPEDLDDLNTLLERCNENSVKWMLIGGGYNILVRDKGFRGVVISLSRMKDAIRLPGNRVRAQSGISNHRLVRFLETEGLSGLEFLIGIPGSVGGALAMNAGCHAHEIMECLESLTIINGGVINKVDVKDLQYGYRYLNIEAGAVIVDACFQLTADDPTAISVRGHDFLEKRRVGQQISYPSAGSFFQNPPGTQAWRLIDAAGVRGMIVGGAQVSEQHANFLVNRGGASANDFLELAKIVKERVWAVSGIDLVEEVRIVGEE